MTLAGVLFLVVGFFVAVLMGVMRTLGSRYLPVVLYLYHVGFTLFYYAYSLSHPADVHRYYSMATTTGTVKLSFGTHAIVWLLSKMHALFPVTLFDSTFFFQLSGFFGLCLLVQAVIEVSPAALSPRARQVVTLLVFLPGLHFWTVSVGKDGLVFLGLVVVLWGLIRSARRWPWMLAGWLLVFAIRPHIAAFVLVALVAAVLSSREVGSRLKLLVVGVATFGAVVFVPILMRYLKIPTFSFAALSRFFADRCADFQASATTLDVSDYSFLLKVFTFHFRPLFFDAPGVMGLIVSVENVALLCMTLFLFRTTFIDLFRYSTNNLVYLFCLYFWLIATVPFVLTIANLGLAIRQKLMFFPFLFVLFTSTYILHRRMKNRPDSGCSAGINGLSRAGSE